MKEINEPIIITDYLNYLKSIRGLSSNTIKEYQYDLMLMIRYMIIRRIYYGDEESFNDDFKNIKINRIVNPKFFESLTLQDFYAFLSFLDNEKNDSSTTRSRKISAIKSFYKYLFSEIEVIDSNISDKLSNPKISQRQPVYLTLNETELLLDTIKNEPNEFLRFRDLAIVFTFLTTGMRLSELVSINMEDIIYDHFNIIGKGNKERTVYLTNNCRELLDQYILIRNKYIKDLKIDALFISTRKKRISNRAVQSTIDKYLKKQDLILLYILPIS